MGKFVEIEDDMIEMFLDGKLDIIAHGCNCYATFGAGIALTVAQKIPEAKIADILLELPEGKKRLGKFSSAEVDRWLIDKGAEGINEDNDRLGLVYNLYTQLNPGRDFRPSALRSALKLMLKDIEENIEPEERKNLRIGFPLIGCGIAGGDWNKVREDIKKTFKDYDVTIVHFNQRVIGVNYWTKKAKTKKAK